MEKQIDQGVPSVYTRAQILLLMVQGAIYGGIVLGVCAGFVAFFYLLGLILPGEDAFSALETSARVMIG